jgi:hypothetical protein
VISCIGDSRVEAPSCCNENCDIAIRDIPTSPEPSISGDACQEIQGVGVRSIGVFKDKKLLHLESRSAISRREVVWATTGVSGGQVAPYRGSGKGKSRIH